MTHNENRQPYNFDPETKREALERAGGVCEACGKPQEKDHPLQADHIIPIFFASLYPAFSITVIKSLANCRILCDTCHKKRNHYDTTEILSLVPVVINRYVEGQRSNKVNSKQKVGGIIDTV